MENQLEWEPPLLFSASCGVRLKPVKTDKVSWLPVVSLPCNVL